MEKLPPLVKALLQPQAYPEKPREVSLGQTHISFLFFAGDYVYKVKKPVNFGFVDFTTLEKRRFFCHREVELNRRLAPEMYLGVVEIRRQGDSFVIGGRGQVAEYAVKMRRLPQEQMMDYLLKEGKVTPDMVERVAEKIARFHRQAETSPEVSRLGGLDTVRQNTEENFSQTRSYIGRSISSLQYERLERYSRNFMGENPGLFLKRMAEGKVRDCHGDLHAAHICFSDGLVIFDCIEFNDRFRYADVASDISFLAMDLDYYRRGDLSRRFVESYVNFSEDGEIERLLPFYKSYRAYVRGKVESFRLDDPNTPEAEKEPLAQRARGYFGLALSYYLLPHPTLFITTGLVGTGKTTLARELSRLLRLEYLSSDIERKRLAGISLQEKRLEGFQEGIYSADFTRSTYETLFRQAGEVLERGCSVIIDASFIKREDRRRAFALAQEGDAGFLALECTSTEETVRARLEGRKAEATASDGRWEIYPLQKEAGEPVTELPPSCHMNIDTAPPVDLVLDRVLQRLEERSK